MKSCSTLSVNKEMQIKHDIEICTNQDGNNQKDRKKLVILAHICNSSYTGDKRVTDLTPVQAKSDLISKTKYKQKG
jgi:hypothetical protein